MNISQEILVLDFGDEKREFLRQIPAQTSPKVSVKRRNRFISALCTSYYI